jgi:hypothetical protein
MRTTWVIADSGIVIRRPDAGGRGEVEHTNIAAVVLGLEEDPDGFIVPATSVNAEGQGRIGGGLHRWPDAQGEAGPAAGIM